VTDLIGVALVRHAAECSARDHEWCQGTADCTKALDAHRDALAREGATSAFDVTKVLLGHGDSWPDERWSTTALLRLVKTEALEPPHRDPRRRILRVTTALARLGERGLPPDAVLRTCLGPALVRRIIIEVSAMWVLAREGRLPREKLTMFEAWLAALDAEPGLTLFDQPTMSDVVATAIRGETVKTARAWLRSASVTHVLGWRLDGYLTTDVQDVDLMLAAGAGAAVWVVDRFTETYLDRWSRESLEWELVFLDDPAATSARVGLPLAMLQERPVSTRQIVDAFSRRLSGAVGDDPVAEGLRTAEIVEAIVGKLRDNDPAAARDLAEAAVRNAPENPHLCNAFAFCLIPVNHARAHDLLDRVAEARDARARVTGAINRATLCLADANTAGVHSAMAGVPDHNDESVWCWDPHGISRGEARLIGVTYGEWRSLMCSALGSITDRSDG